MFVIRTKDESLYKEMSAFVDGIIWDPSSFDLLFILFIILSKKHGEESQSDVLTFQ